MMVCSGKISNREFHCIKRRMFIEMQERKMSVDCEGVVC